MNKLSKSAGIAALMAFMVLPLAALAADKTMSSTIRPGEIIHSTESTAVPVRTRMSAVSGTVGSISGSFITLNAKSTTYSVDASAAKFIRRFGAVMQLSDVQTGDTLAVTGTTTGTSIIAKTIRDMSLQAHNGTFVGTVSGLISNGFTLQSKARGAQTINYSTSTVFRLGSKTSDMTAVAVGETVTVRGVWDRTNSNVTATRVTIKMASMSITGILQSLSGTSFSVITASSTTYSIDASKASVTYKNGRKGTTAILQANDQVTVRGPAVSGSTSIVATLVRDLSQTYVRPSTTPVSTSN